MTLIDVFGKMFILEVLQFLMMVTCCAEISSIQNKTITSSEVNSCFKDLIYDIQLPRNNSGEEELQELCPEVLYSLICARGKLSECNGEDIAASGNSSGLPNLLLTLEGMFYDFCNEETNLTTAKELSQGCEFKPCLKKFYSHVIDFFTNRSAEEKLESLCQEAKNFINCTLQMLSECSVELTTNSSHKYVNLLISWNNAMENFCLGENNITVEYNQASSNRSSRFYGLRILNTVFLKMIFYDSIDVIAENIEARNFRKWLPTNKFKSNLPIYIIIHGYLPGTGDWPYRLKTELMLRGKCNVFIVDWEIGATTFYTLAMGNMKYTGEKVGDFIINLKKRFPSNLGAVHIIGYSLGAHAAGHAGKQVRKILNILVDRITGLDPAGPGFRYKTRDRRLDKTDARLVDVIHTNGADDILKGFGIKQPVGHINFYPDGGEQQEGCKSFSEIFSSEGVKDIISQNLFTAIQEIIKRIKEKVTQVIEDLICSHSRSTELFISSVKHCQFKSIICDSWENFDQCKNLQKLNKSSEVIMGLLYADENITMSEKSLKYFLKTKKSSPYCTVERTV